MNLRGLAIAMLLARSWVGPAAVHPTIPAEVRTPILRVNFATGFRDEMTFS